MPRAIESDEPDFGNEEAATTKLVVWTIVTREPLGSSHEYPDVVGIETKQGYHADIVWPTRTLDLEDERL